MSAQSASTTQSQQLVPRVVEADSRFSRNHPGLLARLGFAALLSVSAPAFAASILLGPTVESFGVLAGSTVTNTGPTTVTGNLGVSPGTAVTGFPPGLVSGGAIHSNDAVAVQAQNELTTAYNTVAGDPFSADLTGQDLGGLTLTPGVYRFTSSASLTGTLTLDYQGNPNAVFEFQIGSTLVTASASSVVLINSGGANCPENVYWQVGSSATIGTGSAFAGNILALTSITLTTGANLNGRALARNGAVTLDTNAVALCAIAAAPTLTLQKIWAVNSIPGNTATVTSSGFANTASSGLSTATLAGNTTTGSAVTVSAGETGTIGEAFGVGSAANYTATLACTGTSGLSGTTLTVGAADTAIVCTETNTLIPPPPTAIPTLAEWTLLMLAMLLLVTGWLQYRRRQ